jgi:hypothetical protein
MLKSLPKEVWAFDAEWVPDVASGRRVYALGDIVTDESVLHTMWERGGATDEAPRPYLKTVLCRVVSVAAVIRRQAADGRVSLDLRSLPNGDAATMTESDILSRFLTGVGKAQPQLVGFNSRSSDLCILMQRAMVHRLSLPDFCRRPAKPWEGVDYFAKGSESHIDLKEEFGGWGRATPSLHELATCCGIPGKTLADGSSVVDLWLAGDMRTVVQYNECDALSTYLLWLRAALLAGHVSTDQHAQEEGLVEALLTTKGESDGQEHLLEYLEEWQALRDRVAA